jgi:transcriptional regulator with XRE-family HTH domain
MTKVRALRIENDLTAKDLARNLKINASSLSYVENRRARASDKIRHKLSCFFGLPEQELFSDDGYAV